MSEAVFSLVNGTIVTVDGEDRVIPDGTVVVEKGIITAVGPSDQLKPRGESYDMKGQIVMPGLVNTHTHSVSPLFRNMADDLKLMDWLQKVIWPAESHLTPEHAYWGARLAFLEFVDCGITTCADQYYFASEVAKAVSDSGITCLLSPSVFTNASAEAGNTLETALEVITAYSGKETETGVIPAIGPHAPYSVSGELWREVAAAAERYGLIIHTHISETLDEQQIIRERENRTPTEFLADCGVFEHPVLAAHCVHLTDGDMEIFRQADAAVTYNPISNLKLVSGIMPLRRLWEHGITVSIGTDGAQSNNSLDLISDLKTGILIQKQAQEDAAFFTAREAVRMATIDGAKSIGMEAKIGSLEVGKRADIVTIDTVAGLNVPFHPTLPDHVFSAIVYDSAGPKVSNVIAGGRFLKRAHQLQIEKEEVVSKASALGKKLMQSAGLL